jgi:hypothetical protein
MYNAGQTAVFTYAGTSLTKVVTEITGTAKITADYSYSGGKLSKIISVQDFTIPFLSRHIMKPHMNSKEKI